MASTATFRIDGPDVVDEGDDVWHVYRGHGYLDSGSEVFCCVALYRKDWEEGAEALGGTRWMPEKDGHTKEGAVAAAKALALAMYQKNRLLKHAAERLEVERGSVPGELAGLYHWQGGKGVIWAPNGVGEPESERLRLHGRLLERLGGLYIGSKDQGIGTRHLTTIAESTEHTIGLKCGRDTGEATAIGVVAGLQVALARLTGTLADNILAGKRILVSGIGKVGLPLVRLLRAEGADVFLYDPDLLHVGVLSEASVRHHYSETAKRGAEVRPDDERLLLDLLANGRIFADEEAALSDPDLNAISPNGGNTEWLIKPVDGVSVGPSRAAIIAGRGNRGLRPILGAANDQLTVTPAEGTGLLDHLASAGWLFVPDPLVSPGGVIAVSHERLPSWDAEAVNRDSREIVEVSVKHFLDRIEAVHGGLARVPGELLWGTFQSLVEEPWHVSE